MSSGLEQLRSELGRIEEALRAFDAPIADELPGMRLMRRTLEQRRSDVADKLRSLQRCQLLVQIVRDGRPDDGMPAARVAELLAALQDGVRRLAVELSGEWSPPPDEAVVLDEAEMWLVAWSPGASAQLTLHFLRRPEEQLLDPTTRTALLVRLLEALAAAVDGGRPTPALDALARVVVRDAVSLDITTVASGGARREVHLDRAAAQQLLATGAGDPVPDGAGAGR
jgi:hypothetical protein